MKIGLGQVQDSGILENVSRRKVNARPQQTSSQDCGDDLRFYLGKLACQY